MHRHPARADAGQRAARRGLHLHRVHAERRPAHGARPSPADDFIEFALDTSQDEPVRRAPGQSQPEGGACVQHERPVKGRTPVDGLSEEDVLQALLEEIGPFVER